MAFHAQADGTHYIAASGESFEWGGYELTVIDITNETGDNHLVEDTGRSGEDADVRLYFVPEADGTYHLSPRKLRNSQLCERPGQKAQGNTKT